MFEIPSYLHDRVNEAISMMQTAIQEVHEALLAKIREASLPSEQERRKYALLQITAFLMTADEIHSTTEAVDRAEKILGEIERRGEQ